MSSREKRIEPIWKSRVRGNEVRNTVCTIQPVQVSFLCHTKVLSGTLKVTFSSVKQMKYRLATNTQSLLSDPLQRAMSSDLLAGLGFFFGQAPGMRGQLDKTDTWDERWRERGGRRTESRLDLEFSLPWSSPAQWYMFDSYFNMFIQFTALARQNASCL